MQTVGAEAGASVGPDGIFSGTAGIIAAPIGVRWNPLRQSVPNVVKPYVAVSAGPVFGSTAGSFLGGGAVVDRHAHTGDRRRDMQAPPSMSTSRDGSRSA